MRTIKPCANAVNAAATTDKKKRLRLKRSHTGCFPIDVSINSYLLIFVKDFSRFIDITSSLFTK
jgi:hypothetical protein